MNRWIKYMLITIAFLLLLGAGAIAWTQTEGFRTWVKNKTVLLMNEQINGKLFIGSIDGNFFGTLQLHNVTIETINGDTLLNTRLISTSYSLLSLLDNRVEIKSIIIETPHVNLSQLPDKTWNFQHLWRPQTDTIAKDNKPFAFTIGLNQLVVTDGLVRIQSPDTIIPKRIENIQIDLHGHYATSDMAITIEHLQLNAKNPNFALNHLSLIAKQDHQTWDLSKLVLTTAQNSMTGAGMFASLEKFSAQLNWDSIRTREFDPFVTRIPLKATPSLILDIQQDGDVTKTEISLINQTQSITIAGTIHQLIASLQNSDLSALTTNLDITMSNVSPSQWIDMEPLPVVVNASVHASGNGITANALPLSLVIDMKNSSWEHHIMQKGDIQMNWLDGIIDGKWNIGGSFGQLAGNGHINLKNAGATTTVSLQTSQLQLHSLFPQIPRTTTLSIDLIAEGSNIMSADREIRLNADVIQSVAFNIPIDTLHLSGNIHDKSYWLDTLTLINASTRLSASGRYLNNKEVSAQLTATLSNSKAFEYYLQQPAKWDAMQLNANATGTIDSLAATISATASGLKLDTTIAVSLFELSGDALWNHQKLSSEIKIGISNAHSGKIKIDTLQLIASQNDKMMHAVLTATMPGPRQLNMTADAMLDTTTTSITIEELTFDTPHSQIYLANGPAMIWIGPHGIRTNHISIADGKAPDFMMNVNAVYSPDSMIAHADISALNMVIINQLGLTTQNLSGTANLSANIEGTRQHISMDGTVQLTDVETDMLKIKKIESNMEFNGKTARFDAAIINDIGDSILMNANAPMHVQLFDSMAIDLPKTITAHLEAFQTRINPFFKQTPGMDQPNAMMNINLDATGNLSDPEIVGSIDLLKGIFYLPQYGINYNDIRLKMAINNKQIALDSLFIKHEKGYLFANGNMKLESSWITPVLSSAALTVEAKKFQLMQHRDFEMTVDAGLSFKSENQQPVFSGKITVLDSDFNMAAIMGLTGNKANTNTPLLVKALNDTIATTNASTDSISDSIAVKISIPLMENLTGSIRLNIPHNTWIRSNETQMELYGDVDVLKTGTYFELFGTLGINRGYYTLYGKKFIIDSGEFTFSGGETFNPGIQLEAHYIFRDQNKEKRQLIFNISGTLSIPEINFTLDGQALTETDAVAYLLFGQPFDQVGYGSREGASGSSMTTKVLGGLVATQLSKTLGNTLNLDMIEIDAGDNWQNTTFMVGKYITNDLFVTYRKDFGKTDNQSVTPDIITLEYEISRMLSLRLVQGDEKSTGIDVIFKYEK